MDREQEARQAFAEKIAKTGGQMIVAELRPFILNHPELVDFDVILPDGSMYVLRDIPCAAIRRATRDEWLAGVRVGRKVGPDEVPPDAPYYFALSFD